MHLSLLDTELQIMLKIANFRKNESTLGELKTQVLEKRKAPCYLAPKKAWETPRKHCISRKRVFLNHPNAYASQPGGNYRDKSAPDVSNRSPLQIERRHPQSESTALQASSL